MNHETQRASILQMAQGAFQERVDYEMQRCVDNILDVNTKATAKRKITLTIELTPDDDRRQIRVNVVAKATLAATNPVATSLCVTTLPDFFRVDMLLRKSHGCTFRELLVLEHPDAVDADFAGGCRGCPQHYGYEPENKKCPHYLVRLGDEDQLCAACWDRIVQRSEAR